MLVWLGRLAAMAAAVATVGVVLAPAASAADDFSDIGQGGSHAANIRALNADGVFAGTECGVGLFCPGQPLARWTVAVWLVRVIDGEEPSSTDTTRFADVDAEQWWAAHVERLAELEVTVGCAQDPLRFCPDAPVTRAQTASLLVRAFGLEAAEPHGFTDTEGSVHADNIDSLAAAGVTVGCASDPPRYCPSDSTSRAQMASFLNRARNTDDADGAPEADPPDGAPEAISSGGGQASSRGSAQPTAEGEAATAKSQVDEEVVVEVVVEVVEEVVEEGAVAQQQLGQVLSAACSTLTTCESVAKEFLAGYLTVTLGTTVTASDIMVGRREPRTWSDYSFGCQVDGYGYGQAEAPGYWFLLTHDDIDHYVHSDESGTQLLLVDGDVGAGPSYATVYLLSDDPSGGYPTGSVCNA